MHMQSVLIQLQVTLANVNQVIKVMDVLVRVRYFFFKNWEIVMNQEASHSVSQLPEQPPCHPGRQPAASLLFSQSVSLPASLPANQCAKNPASQPSFKPKNKLINLLINQFMGQPGSMPTCSTILSQTSSQARFADLNHKFLDSKFDWGRGPLRKFEPFAIRNF